METQYKIVPETPDGALEGKLTVAKWLNPRSSMARQKFEAALEDMLASRSLTLFPRACRAIGSMLCFKDMQVAKAWHDELERVIGNNSIAYRELSFMLELVHGSSSVVTEPLRGVIESLRIKAH